MKKKMFACLSAVLLGAQLFSMTGCGAAQETSWDWQNEPKAENTGTTINVYNWGEYIADDTNAAFEHLTGIKVNYTTFDENESLYTRLKSGAVSYDVIIPSEYMIGKMISEDMLLPLDFDNIPNYQYIRDDMKGLAHDPEDKYSVPYTWGTVGIFYNKKHVDEEDVKHGWDLLWNEKYAEQIVMFGNPRDAFAVALKKLGYSLNSLNPDEWKEAYDELAKQKPILYRYAMDEVYDLITNENAYIAPYYAGDAMIMMYGENGNPDVDFFVPEQGTNRFVDSMCIPVGAENKEAAEAYINFMCRTEVAKANAEYIGYSTPQTEAWSTLDPEVADNPIFYPPENVLANSEIFVTLPDDINELMNDYWIKLKE